MRSVARWPLGGGLIAFLLWGLGYGCWRFHHAAPAGPCQPIPGVCVSGGAGNTLLRGEEQPAGEDRLRTLRVCGPAGCKTLVARYPRGSDRPSLLVAGLERPIQCRLDGPGPADVVVDPFGGLHVRGCLAPHWGALWTPALALLDRLRPPRPLSFRPEPAAPAQRSAVCDLRAPMLPPRRDAHRPRRRARRRPPALLPPPPRLAGLCARERTLAGMVPLVGPRWTFAFADVRAEMAAALYGDTGRARRAAATLLADFAHERLAGPGRASSLAGADALFVVVGLALAGVVAGAFRPIRRLRRAARALRRWRGRRALVRAQHAAWLTSSSAQDIAHRTLDPNADLSDTRYRDAAQALLETAVEEQRLGEVAGPPPRLRARLHATATARVLELRPSRGRGASLWFRCRGIDDDRIVHLAPIAPGLAVPGPALQLLRPDGSRDWLDRAPVELALSDDDSLARRLVRQHGAGTVSDLREVCCSAGRDAQLVRYRFRPSYWVSKRSARIFQDFQRIYAEVEWSKHVENAVFKRKRAALILSSGTVAVLGRLRWTPRRLYYDPKLEVALAVGPRWIEGWDVRARGVTRRRLRVRSLAVQRLGDGCFLVHGRRALFLIAPWAGRDWCHALFRGEGHAASDPRGRYLAAWDGREVQLWTLAPEVEPLAGFVTPRGTEINRLSVAARGERVEVVVLYGDRTVETLVHRLEGEQGG